MWGVLGYALTLCVSLAPLTPIYTAKWLLCSAIRACMFLNRLSFFHNPKKWRKLLKCLCATFLMKEMLSLKNVSPWPRDYKSLILMSMATRCGVQLLLLSEIAAILENLVKPEAQINLVKRMGVKQPNHNWRIFIISSIFAALPNRVLAWTFQDQLSSMISVTSSRNK